MAIRTQRAAERAEEAAPPTSVVNLMPFEVILQDPHDPTRKIQISRPEDANTPHFTSRLTPDADGGLINRKVVSIAHLPEPAAGRVFVVPQVVAETTRRTDLVWADPCYAPVEGGDEDGRERIQLTHHDLVHGEPIVEAISDEEMDSLVTEETALSEG